MLLADRTLLRQPEIFISPDRNFVVLSVVLRYRSVDREISMKFHIFIIVRTDSGETQRLILTEYRGNCAVIKAKKSKLYVLIYSGYFYINNAVEKVPLNKI